MKLLLVVLLLLSSQSVIARSWQEIKKSGVIRIATINDKNKWPVSYMKNGKRVGIDIELIEIVANKLNVARKTKLKHEIINIENVKQRISVLQNNKADLVISSFSVTEKRRDKIDFSIPYMTTGVGLIMSKKFTESVKEFDDLKSHTIGVVDESTAVAIFDRTDPDSFFPNVNMQLFDKKVDAVSALKSEKIDGYSTDRIFLLPFANKQPSKFYVLEGTVNPDPYGIGLQKGNNTLKRKVDNIIRDLEKNGELQRLRNKHLQQGRKSWKETLPPPTGCKKSTYVVVKGDTLQKIANRKLGSPTKWRVIYNQNRDVITYPNIISIGDKLKICSSRKDNQSVKIEEPIIISDPVTNSLTLVEKFKQIKDARDKGDINEEIYKKMYNKIISNPF